ncbi:TnsD family Tn7-like transposition protein [Natranaerobius thermophilus]|uniref:Tn7-like transposition protein D n=1 Tax=Natranaerobius thermophilus (strain ATCC BAA-1301 / DSM 18059 / JW/NM-WN-LF) TaxID=457570 RepID=B2A4S5_NATTJ|nr:TnsD family Tn7-like transposition protein [Natranaerobius thermophilus]ACB83847.1 Tn7-like transposition protein D [Natranaerobius thermophilus JW/NM-WN-LF]
MLTFFTDPYKDELLYSAFARYHFLSGNIDLKDTLRELFGKDSVIPNFELGSNLNVLCQKIGTHYNAMELIKKHTVFPYYSPFLPEQRKQEIINNICTSDAVGIFNKIGIIAGSISGKEGIWYCPDCAGNDLKEFGEVYIHREHQLQGIWLCPHHDCFLLRYPFDKTNTSRIEYIKLNDDLMLKDCNRAEDTDLHSKHKLVSKAAYFLLNNDLSEANKDTILKRYKSLLFDRDLANTNLRVRQKDLHNSLVGYFGEHFLNVLQSLPDENDEYNWLRVATRNVKRTVPPLRHILLITFLTDGHIERFFDDIKVENKPFGGGPWPCLNTASNHYKKNVINEVTVAADYKTRKPVGTFECSCGFTYSRRGPDKSNSDKYRIGRIKNFGPIWEGRLRYLLEQGSLSQNAIAKELNCASGTVKKYKQKLFSEGRSTSKSNDIMKKTKSYGRNLLEKYKGLIENCVCSKKLSRTEIRTQFSKEYTYLYRHDRDWLFATMPPAKKPVAIPNNRVNWQERDEKLLEAYKKAYSKLLNLDEPIRITKTRLGRETGTLSLIQNNSNKLPLSTAYLESISETKQAFQIRRCTNIIENKIKEGLPVRLWEMQREAGLNKEDFKKLKPELERIIDSIKGAIRSE